MTAWAISFAVTLGIELPVAVVSLRDEPRLRVLGVTALCSLLTHPAFWFLFSELFTNYWAYIVTGEMGILVVEALVLWSLLRVDLRTAVATSAFMNAASYLGGLALL